MRGDIAKLSSIRLIFSIYNGLQVCNALGRSQVRVGGHTFCVRDMHSTDYSSKKNSYCEDVSVMAKEFDLNYINTVLSSSNELFL